MAGASGGGRGRGGFSEINVTPLVDVMLVLLIVFMVTAPLLSASLRVELPKVDSGTTGLRDTKLVITVTREARIVLGDRDVTDDLEAVLRSDPGVQAEREVYVRADKDVAYSVVARVVAAARGAGVTGINLLVEPERP